MTHTRDKLDEAKQYLEVMCQTQENRKKFTQAFSAFLSAARSVTYVMQKEFAPAGDFADWYAGKQAWMKAKPLFDCMNQMRVENLHLTGGQPTMRVTMPVGDNAVHIEAALEVPHRSGVKEMAEAERVISAPTGTTIKWMLYREPWGERKPDSDAHEAISASEEWVKHLETLVDECEKTFLGIR